MSVAEAQTPKLSNALQENTAAGKGTELIWDVGIACSNFACYITKPDLKALYNHDFQIYQFEE